MGAVEAMKYAFDKNILIIPGIEVLTKSGDVIGVNVRKVIPDGLTAEETIKSIRKQGGIAVIPHPFDRPTNFWGGKNEMKNLRPDAIEIFNASAILPYANRRARKFLEETGFAFTAGSDAHKTQYVGWGYLEFPGKLNSEKDVVEAIMEKRGKAGGRKLRSWQVLRNGFGADVKKIARYYLFKRKNKKDKV